MTVVTVRPFAAMANTLAANAVAFRQSAETLDTLATPFARSVLASVLNGASLEMVEQVVLASLGSPKGGAKGKPLTMSGIARDENDVKGGRAIYQEWKAIVKIVGNIGADEWVVAPTETDVPLLASFAVPGANAIRPAVVGFVLQDDNAPATLRGANGLELTVKRLMADHAKAIAALVAAPAASNEGEGEGDASEGEGDATPGRMSLTDRANAMLLAWNEASADEKTTALDAISALLAAIDADTLAIEDTAPEAMAG